MARILIYATQLLNTGGIESHIFEFCRVMSAAGHQIDLIVPKCRLDAQKKNILKSSCHQTYFHNTFSSAAVSFFLILRSVLLFIKKYDILYTNGQGNTILWSSRLFRYRQWVHHHHTSGDAHDLELWSPSYFTAVLKCSHLVVCSELILNRLSTKLNRKIITVPVFSRNLEGTVRSGNHKVNTPVRFGYFGRLIPEKGIDFLCRLSNDTSCQHISFHLWGSGSDEIINRLREFPNLKYHGAFNDKTQLQEIVSGLDGYLLLSTHHEGLPVSLLEVMSAGLPWLATDKGGIHELFISENATRIIPADADYDTIRAAVLKFAEDCIAGLINQKDLIARYQTKYASAAVLQRWDSLMSA